MFVQSLLLKEKRKTRVCACSGASARLQEFDQSERPWVKSARFKATLLLIPNQFRPEIIKFFWSNAVYKAALDEPEIRIKRPDFKLQVRFSHSCLILSVEKQLII